MTDQKHVALVTGANRGIGLECCRQLAKAELSVILTARDTGNGLEAVESLRSEGFDVTFHVLDVTEDASVERLAHDITRNPGRLDVLVNNAGVYLDEGRKLADIEPGVFPLTIETNLTGAYRMMRAFIPLMKKQKYGRIVNVSSGYGAMAAMTSGTGSYKVSKLALNGLTRIFADEVNDRHIKINAADPGWVRTDMGGRFATRSPKKAAEGIVRLALLDEDGPSGGFFRDGQPVEF